MQGKRQEIDELAEMQRDFRLPPDEFAILALLVYFAVSQRVHLLFVYHSSAGYQLKIVHLVLGLVTFLPGMRRLRLRGTGGTTSAKYCYSVWLRHLIKAHEAGQQSIPMTVAELGPGDSLGIGLAALLSGAERYFALDVVAHANQQRNLVVLDELVELFAARTPIPSDEEFEGIKPLLADYSFPSALITDSALAETLAPARIASLREALTQATNTGMISYKVPWDDPSVLPAAKVDMVFSQAVLEHIDDLDFIYAAMRRWLRPGGFMSHQIDFRCHGMAQRWNGHWCYSDMSWALLRGRRPYLINRAPCSVHLALLGNVGFEPGLLERQTAPNELRASELAPRFRGLSALDLETAGLFLIAKAPGLPGKAQVAEQPNPLGDS